MNAYFRAQFADNEAGRRAFAAAEEYHRKLDEIAQLPESEFERGLEDFLADQRPDLENKARDALLRGLEAQVKERVQQQLIHMAWQIRDKQRALQGLPIRFAFAVIPRTRRKKACPQ
jgi:hypothetical protein